MKKIVSILLAVCMLAICLAGCGNTAPTSTEGNENGSLTVTDGVFKVGMEIGYPPMEYLDEDGSTPIGFDVDIANYIAEQLGLKAELINTGWDGIFSSLDSNRYDAVISAVSINEERQKNYNLTKPYIANKILLVTRKGMGIKSPDDLTGYKVATQTETTSDEFMKEKIANGLELSDYFVYDQILQCFDELKLGRIDGVMVDSVVVAYYMGEDSDAFEIAWENDEAEPMGICLKKGNDELTAKIEEIIDEMYSNGKMEEIAAKHFGDASTVSAR